MMRKMFLAFALIGFAVAAANAQAPNAANAVPPNYRQLVAQKILESTDPRKIRKARISQPHVLWAGLAGGGNRPAICVEVIRETFLTSDARDVWVFTFQDGRIATAGYSYADCGSYAPFDELLKRK
jgi:hypothetical protein